MKKANRVSKTNSDALKISHLNDLVVGPLADLIHRQRLDYIEQGRRIFEKLKEVDELIAIIARQLKRETERGDQ